VSALAVELGEGFSGDEVVVLVDGRQVWRGSDVTTNWSVGLADVVRVPEVPIGATVEVRARGSSASRPVADATATHGDGGELRLRAGLDPDGGLRVEPADLGPVM
jgi:hypothetical protein